MDLLASVLAYFGTVTTIIVAVVICYDAFVYAPATRTTPTPFAGGGRHAEHG